MTGEYQPPTDDTEKIDELDTDLLMLEAVEAGIPKEKIRAYLIEVLRRLDSFEDI